MKLKVLLCVMLCVATNSLHAMDNGAEDYEAAAFASTLLVEGVKGTALCALGLGPWAAFGSPLLICAAGLGLVLDQTGESKKWLASVLCCVGCSGFTFATGAQKLFWCAEQMGYSRNEVLLLAAAGSATFAAVVGGKKVVQLMRGHSNR